MWQNPGVDFSEVERKKNIVNNQGCICIKAGLENSDCFYESILLRPLNVKVVDNIWKMARTMVPNREISPFGREL